jgi:hypothetical protein
MPVNDKIYQMILDKFSYDPDYTVKCIEANRHNQITATYHLMSKQITKNEKMVLSQEESKTINMLGSLDRGTKPTRLQMHDEQLKQDDQTIKI